MILQALNQYYERLENDPEVEIAPFGFSRQQIAFCVTLNKDGTLHAIDDIRDTTGKKPAPQSLVVLGNAKPSGSGINPGLLWDNPAYMLGYKADDAKPQRTKESFEAFRQRHLDAEAAVNDPEFSAVCRFLEKWKPAEASKHPALVELSTGFGVFRIRAANHYVHEQKAVRKWWQKQLKDSDADGTDSTGQCLVTGETDTLARLHEPKIKGVWGAQSSGAAIVSFNLDAFESYGKKQSLNSPVSERAAFQYCTALNHLLQRDNCQRVQVGDTSVVFWTENSTEAEKTLPWIFAPSKSAENESLRNRVGSVMRSIVRGTYPSELGNAETPFYILGLSPNAARISVRFWLVSTLGEFIDKLRLHFSDLEVCDIRTSKSDGPHRFHDDLLKISPMQILNETVIAKNGRPDSEKISPQLSGALLRSILSGGPYPAALLEKTLYRVSADGFVDADKRLDWKKARRRRAAIIKACINRRLRQLMPNAKELTVDAYLNKIHPDPVYHCGRLMAVIAFIQEVALRRVNASVVRRFLSAASVSPALYLGRLQVQAEIGHLPKLKGRLPRFLRDEMKSINCQIRDEIPVRVSQLRQGLFVLGFYHEYAHLEQLRLSVRRLYRTKLGEWVYSKGELMIADALAARGIQYFYEPKAILDGEDRIPDFLILGAIRQEDIYLEFLGVDTEKYSQDWENKLIAYSRAGITSDGGPHGRLLVIDGRKEIWDEAKVLAQLAQWFAPTPSN